jgi:DNA polymerase I
MKVIKNVDPDILTGWNSDRFDLPFVVDRLNTNNIPTSLLSRMSQTVEPYHTTEGEIYKIRGRIVIDYLKAFKKVHIKEMDSYSLENVAQEELGHGKIDIKDLPETMWKEKRYDELLRYNKMDVQLMVELDEKLRIIEFLDKISTIASCDFADTLYNSRIVDSYILKYTSERGIILPSRKFTNGRSNYSGGKVLYPEVGLHKNVTIADMASLYPSIIRTFNLSPETMQSESRVRDEVGLVPILLKDLLILRQQYRNEGRDTEQAVVKTIANSMYGVLALPTFRLYTPSMAAEVTRRGREIIELLKKEVDNYEPIS